MKNENVKYHGFDLNSVTWGYRDIFKNFIDQLYRDKLLGENNQTSTDIFFRLLTHHQKTISHDHVLKNFLEALNSEHKWILKIPALFSDWTNLGTEFTRQKNHMGLAYFEIWGKGGFGNTPEEVQYVINKARYLLPIDTELAFYFIASVKKLRHYLSNREIDIFIEHTLTLFARSPQNAITFLQLKTKTSRCYLQMISREVRLDEVKNRLALYAGSISGEKITIDNHGSLDSDDLIERGSTVISLPKWLYLPAKAARFSTREHNLDYYMLTTAIAASSLLFKSFSSIHGTAQASSSFEYINCHYSANAKIINNSFIVFEYYRILKKMITFFPGTREALSLMIEDEKNNCLSAINANKIIFKSFAWLFGGKREKDSGIRTILELIRNYATTRDFQRLIHRLNVAISEKKHIGLFEKYFADLPQPISFMPDFMFPITISSLPDSNLAADLNHDQNQLKNSTDTNTRKNKQIPELSMPDSTAKNNGSEKNTTNSLPMVVGHLYDEWNEHEKDYFEKWCCLREKSVPAATVNNDVISKDIRRLSHQVKKIFERLKPDLVRKEKYLSEGDSINIDQLIHFVSLRKAQIFEIERFYEKPFINKRDIAVALLLDMSGSTGNQLDDAKTVLEFEKEAALILGEGLAEVGDQFGIFGFTGNGRGNAEYYIFKDFGDEWNNLLQKSLFSAHAGSATRMGVAIRHTGSKLEKHHSKKKLIIMITDGKPMDSGYDSNNRYAQYDVRKANEENYRKGIDSFCISTEENKIEDLEIMFPFHRYTIIKSMAKLPEVLSRFYLTITR